MFENRIQNCNQQPVNAEGDYILYWMIASRRTSWNFSLDRAVVLAEKFGKPLVILEALRCDYRWASNRLHTFVIQGMAVTARRFANKPVLYYPYIEPVKGAGKGLLEKLSEKACVVITDDFPCFFLPKMVAAAAKKLPVKLEKVDSNGLLPMRAAEQVYARAFTFRRFLQHELPLYLDKIPAAEPFANRDLPEPESLGNDIMERWPRASEEMLSGSAEALSKLPIDHSVEPVESSGGSDAAEKMLRIFLQEKLQHYSEQRNEPEKDMTSGLSPYLHFGHLSVHQVFSELIEKEDWTIGRLSGETKGKREGWWGMSKNAEDFLDELITWREIGYNMCWQRSDYAEYDSLPDWAKTTLAEHASDAREHVYNLSEFEKAASHDDLWNAAQLQLVREGRIHNYLRMLWGKKIIEWTKHPQDALEIMIELNNKYALDGRNPNSYSGIFWVLGRYDRPWGPERKIFGKVRYMTSKNTARKFDVKNYIARLTPE